MKKVFVLVCAMATIAFTSCNSNSTSSDVECDSISTDSTACVNVDKQIESLSAFVDAKDGDGLQSKIDEIKTQIQKMIDEGKIDEAKKYSEAFKQFIEENKEKINSFSPAICEIATNAANQADEIVASVTSAVGSTVKSAKDAAVDATEDVVSAAQTKANEAKDAANAKVQEVQDKANEKVQEAQDKAKNKANDAIDKAAGDIKNKLGL